MGWPIRVRFLAQGGDFFLLRYRVQTGSWANPSLCPWGTEGLFSGGKAAGS